MILIRNAIKIKWFMVKITFEFNRNNGVFFSPNDGEWGYRIELLYNEEITNYVGTYDPS